MATSTIMNPNSTAITQNLKSITRVVASDTTGASGNIILPYENDGTTFVVGAHAYGTNAFLRTWVSATNNHWFFPQSIQTAERHLTILASIIDTFS